MARPFIEFIQAQALESSNFIESVRAIQSLKLFNRESEREAQWLNRYADVVNANIRLGRTKVAFSISTPPFSQRPPIPANPRTQPMESQLLRPPIRTSTRKLTSAAGPSG
jgi:hypothetical protein